MLEAALAIVEHHGKDLMSSLLPILEDFLENAPNTQSFDVVRQGVVVILGTMAKHLDKGLGMDEKHLLLLFVLIISVGLSLS